MKDNNSHMHVFYVLFGFPPFFLTVNYIRPAGYKTEKQHLNVTGNVLLKKCRKMWFTYICLIERGYQIEKEALYVQVYLS